VRPAFTSVVLFWTIPSLTGCASGPNTFGFEPPDGGDDASIGASDASRDASNERDAPPSFGEGGGGSDCTCSTDLLYVICNGQQTVCPPGTGCIPGGMCVDSCASAAASQSSVGCEFYAQPPAPFGALRGSCYAVILESLQNDAVWVTVDYGGSTLDLSGFARDLYDVSDSGAPVYHPILITSQGGQVSRSTILFLAAHATGTSLDCGVPGVTPAVTATFADVSGTGIGQAFHIVTTGTSIAYDVYPWGGASAQITSASLLIPTSAWGTNYIAADGYAAEGASQPTANPYLQIGAAQDGTTVTIKPTVDIVTGTGVAPTARGSTGTYTLNKGEFLQFLQPEELVGSPIASDKPISVWGGNSAMTIPAGYASEDSAHQQLVPIKTLGSEYVGVRYRSRSSPEEAVPWRFVGVVDGTSLTFDPPQQGAPSTLVSGQLAQFSAPGPFVARSQDDQHPFYMSAHMTGQAFGAPTDPDHDGDPDYVNVVPPAQWLARYWYVTDPTYKNTSLIFIQKKDPSQPTPPIWLGCMGSSPVSGWQPIDAAGLFDYARVDLVLDGAPQGRCGNGPGAAKSIVPFGLVVWGWDTAVSYAYPAGMGVVPINPVVVPTQ
jgi:hypothetical protein